MSPAGEPESALQGTVVSCGWYDKFPRTWRLRTTPVYCLTVLETRSPTWVVPRLPASPGSRWHCSRSPPLPLLPPSYRDLLRPRGPRGSPASPPSRQSIHRFWGFRCGHLGGPGGGVVLLTTAGQPWHERPRSLPPPRVPPFPPDTVPGLGMTRSLPSQSFQSVPEGRPT